MEKLREYEERLIDFIRRARIEKDFTQAMLSKISGVSRQAISNFERGATGLNSTNLLKLFIALEKEDVLAQLFPKNYTTPILEIKKENLQKLSRKMRVRKAASSQAKPKPKPNPIEKSKGKKDRQVPFASTLAKKREDLE
jgi:transcriptional regulator with XRE-family HTH domain